MSRLSIVVAVLALGIVLFGTPTAVLSQEGPVSDEPLPMVNWPSEARYEYAFGPIAEVLPVVVWPSEVRYAYAFGPVTEELPLVMWPSEERYVYAMSSPTMIGLQDVNKALLGSALEALFVDGDASALYAAYPADLAAIRLDEWTTWQSAFGDMEATLDFQLAEGDRVLSCWRFSGVHDGEFLGIAPTGREVSFRGLFSARIANGQVVEEVGGADLAELMGQIGPIAASWVG